MATVVALATDVAGVILLDAMIGNHAFTENAAAQAAPLATSLGVPVAGFDAYLAAWRARRERFSDDAERLLDRWVRFALAPLPGGAYRVRALRAAVEAEWASIIAADSLGALARVRCPVMIVQVVKSPGWQGVHISRGRSWRPSSAQRRKPICSSRITPITQRSFAPPSRPWWRRS